MLGQELQDDLLKSVTRRWQALRRVLAPVSILGAEHSGRSFGSYLPIKKLPHALELNELSAYSIGALSCIDFETSDIIIAFPAEERGKDVSRHELASRLGESKCELRMGPCKMAIG